VLSERVELARGNLALLDLVCLFDERAHGFDEARRQGALTGRVGRSKAYSAGSPSLRSLA
jgi:hypothetical protein